MRKMQVHWEGKTKLTLSLLLLVFAGVVAGITGVILVATAMLASSIGDYSIMKSRGVFGDKKDKKYFARGVIAFAVAHLLYIFAMQGTKWWGNIVVLDIICCLLTIIMAVKRDKFGDMMNVPYAACLILAAINGWQFHWLAGIGYVQFIISDLILAIGEDRDPKYQIPIWATYVPGQACIIASVLVKTM